MTGAPEKRQMVRELAAAGLSQRRACAVVGTRHLLPPGDGEVHRYTTSQEGLRTSLSQMQYLFLPKGSHTVSFRMNGGSVYVLR